MKPALTTGDVAKYCHVTISTVSRWIGRGLLPSYTLPTGHRRILSSEFRAFLEQHGMPIQESFFSDDGPEPRVLIVDDEPQVVRTITEALTRGSLELKVASTNHGFEAGLLVVTFKPQLVVLDLMMPGVDGFQVCQLIRSNPDTDHTRVLAVTGFSEPETLERILALGADDYMEKPLDTDELLSKVQQLLLAGPRQPTGR